MVAYYTMKKIYPFPAFPLENIVDPNGAGDSFAGGFIGTLSKLDASNPTIGQLKTYWLRNSNGSLAVSDFQ